MPSAESAGIPRVTHRHWKRDQSAMGLHMNILRCHRICCWLAVLLLAVPPPVFAQPATGVGFAAITIHDPVNGGTMPGYVFYPTTHAGGMTWVGPYELHATP